jgi:hypothetical protein
LYSLCFFCFVHDDLHALFYGCLIVVTLFVLNESFPGCGTNETPRWIVQF